MQIGLVGLQFSGKSTLFNSLSKAETDVYSSKEEASIEVIKVPDERLDILTEMFKPEKKTNATIEVFDIPGLRTSDDGKVRITNAFLNDVKNNDALFYVVRQFKDDTVSHPLTSIDPLRDIKFLETEFLLSDLSFFENRLGKLRKEVMKTKDDRLKRELPVAEKCLEHLENELPLRTIKLDDSERKLLSGYQLLTMKPLAIAVNFDEDSILDFKDEMEKIEKGINDPNVSLIPFSAKLENELAKLDEDDQKEFMADYGITESTLTKILRTSYNLLGLHSFLTVGEEECRAWTIKESNTAQEAAGVIHTDFYNRFIKAEVVSYDSFMEHGSFAKCKEAGTWRLEGKEYIVKDGDILVIRHN